MKTGGVAVEAYFIELRGLVETRYAHGALEDLVRYRWAMAVSAAAK